MAMLPSKLFEVSGTLASILRSFSDAGVKVELGDDFTKYRALRGTQEDRSAMYPMFDPASSFVDATNGFWLCGFDGSGELIHTQAVRRLELADSTLAGHLAVHRQKYITPDTTPDPDQTFYSGPAGLGQITGTVCYHGDFWLQARGLGGPRSQGATALFSRILFEVMVGCWNPDYVFAFVPSRLGAKGAHLRYGYSRCEPGRWQGPDGQITEEDYLIWMTRADMGNMMIRAPESLGRAPVTAVTHPAPVLLQEEALAAPPAPASKLNGTGRK